MCQLFISIEKRGRNTNLSNISPAYLLFCHFKEALKRHFITQKGVQHKPCVGVEAIDEGVLITFSHELAVGFSEAQKPHLSITSKAALLIVIIGDYDNLIWILHEYNLFSYDLF